jgi:hypothetical protein
MDDANRLITVSELTGTPLHVPWMRGEEMLGRHLAGLFENTHPRDVLGEKTLIKVG